MDNVHDSVSHVGTKVDDAISKVEDVRQMMKECKLPSYLSPLWYHLSRARVGYELLTVKVHPPGSGQASSLEGFAALMDD